MTLVEIAIGIVVAILWGFNFVVIDVGLHSIPPFLLVCLRYALVALCFMPFTRRNGIAWRWIIAVGLLYGVVQFTGLFVGISLGVSAGLAATLMQTQAVFTILLAQLLLHDRLNLRQMVGVFVAAAGLAVITIARDNSAPLIAVLLVLLGALGWAASNIVVRKAGNISAWSLTVWQSLVPILPMFAMSLIFERDRQEALVRNLNPLAIGTVCYIAIVSTGAGNYLWYRLIQRVGPAKGAPFSLLIPVVGLVSGWLVLNERLGLAQLLGIALCLLGLALVALKDEVFRRNRPVPAMEEAATPAVEVTSQ
jgi:O-acetylserine/cysteine efflux transporter